MRWKTAWYENLCKINVYFVNCINQIILIPIKSIILTTSFPKETKILESTAYPTFCQGNRYNCNTLLKGVPCMTVNSKILERVFSFLSFVLSPICFSRVGAKMSKNQISQRSFQKLRKIKNFAKLKSVVFFGTTMNHRESWILDESSVSLRTNHVTRWDKK